MKLASSTNIGKPLHRSAHYRVRRSSGWVYCQLLSRHGGRKSSCGNRERPMPVRGKRARKSGNQTTILVFFDCLSICLKGEPRDKSTGDGGPRLQEVLRGFGASLSRCFLGADGCLKRYPLHLGVDAAAVAAVCVYVVFLSFLHYIVHRWCKVLVAFTLGERPIHQTNKYTHGEFTRPTQGIITDLATSLRRRPQRRARQLRSCSFLLANLFLKTHQRSLIVQRSIVLAQAGSTF